MTTRTKNAIILAAGRGSRLGSGEEGTSKALISLGDETIIDYQIRVLEAHGIERIAVVTGFARERVCGHLGGHRVITFHNPDFDTTNSLYSLTLAEEVGREGALVLNSDVLFHPSLMAKILDDPAPNAILVDYTRELAEEEMKVVVKDGLVTAIAKDLAVEPGMGENVGIIKIGKRDAGVFFDEAKKYLAEVNIKAWAPRGIHILVGRVPFKAITVEGEPWTEIDFQADLEGARERVYPLCLEASRALRSSKP